MKDNTGEAESPSEEAIFSEERFNDIVGGMDQDDWILANAARLVYYAGFHKNEIENIKIGHVRSEEAIVSVIEPFLPETKKAYSTMPIILNNETTKIIEDHINKLRNNRYLVNLDNPLFPDKKTKSHYNSKTLYRQFKKHFGNITFDDLRAHGFKNLKDQLEGRYLSKSQRQKELQKLSRHSRPSTSKKLINGDVQKAGKTKKEDLPWESIVRAIEGSILEFDDVGNLNRYLKNIQNNISSIKKKDVKESLEKLYNHYVYKNK